MFALCVKNKLQLKDIEFKDYMSSSKRDVVYPEGLNERA